MFSRTPTPTLLVLSFLWICTASVSAHVAAWHDSMYCRNGTSGTDNTNTFDIVTPLYKMTKKDWWFHGVNGCNKFPPAPGKFLELPAGGDFTVEIATNRGKTSLSFAGKFANQWMDGGDHPDNWNEPGCITNPNIHTQNEQNAAGTAFAISYESDIDKVTEENLVVFSVRYHTPWRRVTSYSVPAALPACPEGGCHCAWGWIPNGCGEPNMYHQAFKCKVTNAKSVVPVAPGKPPVWCEDDPSKCVKGAKQMLYWNQLEGNNIEVKGLDLSGKPRSPGYNMKCGFADGAQNDIFGDSSSAPPPPTNSPPPSPVPPSKPPTVNPPISINVPIPSPINPPVGIIVKPPKPVQPPRPNVSDIKNAANASTPPPSTGNPPIPVEKPNPPPAKPDSPAEAPPTVNPPAPVGLAHVEDGSDGGDGSGSPKQCRMRRPPRRKRNYARMHRRSPVSW